MPILDIDYQPTGDTVRVHLKNHLNVYCTYDFTKTELQDLLDGFVDNAPEQEPTTPGNVDEIIEQVYNFNREELIQIASEYLLVARAAQAEYPDQLRIPLPTTKAEDPEPPYMEGESLGPCGCTDYHMSDCPLMTAVYDAAGVDDYDPYD